MDSPETTMVNEYTRVKDDELSTAGMGEGKMQGNNGGNGGNEGINSGKFDKLKKKRKENFSVVKEGGYKGVNTVFTKPIHKIIFDIQIKNVDSPVFSFSGEAVWPIAIAEVHVRLGLKQKIVEFIVMDIESSHNVILSRGWLRKMKVVTSPFHQKLKFPSDEGIVVVPEK